MKTKSGWKDGGSKKKSRVRYDRIVSLLKG